MTCAFTLPKMLFPKSVSDFFSTFSWKSVRSFLFGCGDDDVIVGIVIVIGIAIAIAIAIAVMGDNVLFGQLIDMLSARRVEDTSDLLQMLPLSDANHTRVLFAHASEGEGQSEYSELQTHHFALHFSLHTSFFSAIFPLEIRF